MNKDERRIIVTAYRVVEDYRNGIGFSGVHAVSPELATSLNLLEAATTAMNLANRDKKMRGTWRKK